MAHKTPKEILMGNNIQLKKEQYDTAVDELQRYFENERDESIGILQAKLLLDFMLETIGPSVYKQAISDMQKFLYDKIDDLYEFERC